MKKLLLSQAVTILSFIFLTHSYAQSVTPTQQAYDYLLNRYGLDAKAIGELKIKDQYKTDHNGVEHLHFVQVVKGLEVFGSHFNLALQPNGNVSASGHSLKIVGDVTSDNNLAKIEAPAAIGIVANSLGITSRSVPTVTRTLDSGVPVYSKGDISHQDIPAQLGYLMTEDGKLTLTWKLHVESKANGNLYQSFVNATDGKLIANDQLTLHCSFDHGYLQPAESCDHVSAPFVQAPPPPVNAVGTYRVLPLGIESPNHGSFELVTGTDDLIASPFGWHDTDGAAGNEYTYTRGNNVHAFLDRNWDYASDGNLDGGASLNFDFPFSPDTEPSANQNVALTNLFYWNNLMHDFTFRYGFNEVAGNFQERNYAGQGANEDYVEAHAQFGDSDVDLCGQQANGGTACLNNADFSTPVDGFNGRMRMFTWNSDNSSKFLDVIEPLELSGKILTGVAEFGADITTTAVTGFVVVADDGSSNGSHACNTLADQSDVNGKIVIIDRGLCDFSEKAYNAELGGAIGAIICNFEENTIGMAAGTNAEFVTIPTVLIARSDCERIRVAAADGLKVSLVAPEAEGGPERRDGSLDNGVIAHEYGHGISNRLTGGPSNTSCLSPGAQTGDAEESYGMGEGWSDFFGLVTTVRPGDTGGQRRGIGTYASKEETDGGGIRSYPYSTDMNENPHTYDDILFESLPHGVGSVWAAMLWDMYWAFVDAYGFDEDLYGGTGGNNIAIQLVMDGLKLQNCNPGFMNARDAILQADQINNNGVNECLIWGVFARRGLGWDAVGGDKNSRSDGIEGFESLPSCVKELKLTKSMTPEIKAGDQISVTLVATNYTDGTLTNVSIEDLIPDGATYVDGSATITPIVGNSLVWTLDPLEPGEEVSISYLLNTSAGNNSTRMFYDDIEGDPIARWDILYDDTKTISNFWQPQDVRFRSGTQAWVVEDIPTTSEHYLLNFDPYTISGDYPVYRFYHYYNTETGADGGFLEITTNDGDTWQSLEDHMFRNAYPRRLQYTTFAIPNLYAFSGLSSPTFQWTPVYIDLRDFIGEQVKIRYRFGTDDNSFQEGWYVDDIEIMDAVIFNTTACIVTDQTTTLCAEAPERGTIVDSEITISTEDHLDASALMIRPNPAGDFIQINLDADLSEVSTITVFDLTGHQLHSGKWNLTNGTNQHLLDLTRFTPGMYVLHIQTSNGVYAKKFVKN